MGRKKADRALCAPGRRDDATWALAVAGESVKKLSEHPWLKDGTVIVMNDVPLPRPEFPLPSFEVRAALYASSPPLTPPAIITGTF